MIKTTSNLYFLFSKCKVYIGTTSKINKYNGHLRRGRGGDVTKHNVEFKRRHHWQMLNRYFEKNYTYINDINLVWRGGGWQLIHVQLIEKNPNTSIAKKCMYSGLKNWCWSTQCLFNNFFKKPSNKPIWHFLSKSCV